MPRREAESKEVLRIWAANIKELLNGEGAASCLELPSSVRRDVEMEEKGREEVETAMHKMEKGKATEAQLSTETVGEGFRRKDQDKSRR